MNNQENSARRNFLKTASIGGLMMLAAPELLSAAESKAGKISLAKNDIILFQGDSITDAGRKRDALDANNTSALGSGYAMLAAAALLNAHPEKDLQIFNRGISGNKVYQLAERWDKDCLDIKPTVLSILIGVNDYWHKHNGNYAGTSEVYRKDFIALLDRTKQKLPDVKLIIAEPFAVKGVKSVDDTWYPEFDEYRMAAKEIAAQFNATFISYQKVFDDAQKEAPAIYWTKDGVHPALPGAELMAQAWLKTIKS